jgi:hypothetical protein
MGLISLAACYHLSQEKLPISQHFGNKVANKGIKLFVHTV